jgi:chromate transporter
MHDKFTDYQQKTGKPADYSLKELFLYFLKLGTIGFGGPVALVVYMHRDLVEKYKWIDDEEYKEGLALSQLAPGPLAAQLAIYIGFVHYRIIGATLAGIAFVLPSFIIVIFLGIAYVKFGGLHWMQAVFYGVGAAVIGIISVSSFKLTKKTLRKDWLLWTIFLVVAVFTFWTETENLWLILAAGFIAFIAKTKRFFSLNSFYFHPYFLQIVDQIPFNEKLFQIAMFFLKAGAFVFGSGLAIVPFLYGGVVKDYKWLNDQQFLDAVAIAMITPGPVVITVGFIGYLVAGLPGACVAALATFLPCFLFTVIPAPYFKKYGKRPGIKHFVDGVTAAAIGAIAGAVIVFGKRQLTDLTSFLIALTTCILLLRFRKLPEPVIILAAAISGLVLRHFVANS